MHWDLCTVCGSDARLGLGPPVHLAVDDLAVPIASRVPIHGHAVDPEANDTTVAGFFLLPPAAAAVCIHREVGVVLAAAHLLGLALPGRFHVEVSVRRSHLWRLVHRLLQDLVVLAISREAFEDVPRGQHRHRVRLRLVLDRLGKVLPRRRRWISPELRDDVPLAGGTGRRRLLRRRGHGMG